MKPGYEPTTALGMFGWILEETGEVLQAVGKSMRFGLDGKNPDLPEEERESNLDAIVRESEDLWRAVTFAYAAAPALVYIALMAKLTPQSRCDVCGEPADPTKVSGGGNRCEKCWTEEARS